MVEGANEWIRRHLMQMGLTTGGILPAGAELGIAMKEKGQIRWR